MTAHNSRKQNRGIDGGIGDVRVLLNAATLAQESPTALA